jgi:hypothetical protein
MKGLEMNLKNRIMRLDDCGHDALQREGLRLKPYLDTQGIPTIWERYI